MKRGGEAAGGGGAATGGGAAVYNGTRRGHTEGEKNNGNSEGTRLHACVGPNSTASRTPKRGASSLFLHVNRQPASASCLRKSHLNLTHAGEPARSLPQYEAHQ